MKRVGIFCALFLVALFGSAQGITGNQDFFKSDLKIYVVLSVLTIILTCLFLFLFSLERRLKSLEKKQGLHQ